MNPESEIAKKIVIYLNHGAAQLKAGTAYRLQQARAQALARLADPRRAVSLQMAHALAGTGTDGDRRGTRSNLRWFAGVALFAVVAWFGWQQWQAFEQAKEFEELDAQILTSDLPIDAYVDRGFQNWLRASFEH
jgi:Protein of unknown function (DUF3619)